MGSTNLSPEVFDHGLPWRLQRPDQRPRLLQEGQTSLVVLGAAASESSNLLGQARDGLQICALEGYRHVDSVAIGVAIDVTIDVVVRYGTHVGGMLYVVCMQRVRV